LERRRRGKVSKKRLESPDGRVGGEGYMIRIMHLVWPGVYDPYYKRFYVVIVRMGKAGRPDFFSEILLAISASSNPARNWYLYRIDA
jgi:hypothetical protein